MRKILVIGAGKSSPCLIRYLLERASEERWRVVVGDRSLPMAQRWVGDAAAGEAMALDVMDEGQRRKEIGESDLVISMLPASMHPMVARDCLAHGVHLVTASYVSDEMAALAPEAERAGLVFLNEAGVDPGIDHISALHMLDELRGAGHELIRFESFTGGLLTPKSEEGNPWKYKFTWNPRNVVLAGSGSAVKFLQEGQYKYIPYHRLFRRTEIIEIEGYGKFEGYANRDSLKYIDVYGLRGIQTMYRGTLRRPGFCRAWNCFVQLGMTDDSYAIEGSESMTYRQFLNAFLLHDPHNSVELKLMHYMKLDHDAPELEKLAWLGLFGDQKIGLKDATPAQILQHILEQKWTMGEDDRDMIAMYHKFHVKDAEGVMRQMEASMVAFGEDQEYTAMARTVGLTAGIGARLILSGGFTTPGVHRPIIRELYLPMLLELEKEGLTFSERETPLRYETMY